MAFFVRTGAIAAPISRGTDLIQKYVILTLNPILEIRLKTGIDA